MMEPSRDNNDEHDSWDYDTEQQDVVPLVSNADNSDNDSSSALRRRRLRRQRLKSLEIAMLAEEDSTYYPSCLGESWRLLASILLAILMATPLILRWKFPRTSWPSDSLPCAKEYGISFSTPYKQMEEATDFCKESAKSCTCTSPFIPQFAVSDLQKDPWEQTLERNMKLAVNANATTNLVLVGDSITEHWLGTGMGKPKHADVHEVYQELFQNSTSEVQGLALGISGDRCPQLLYRLRNGEMPSSLNPKVWWILIGTNDLAAGCLRESVLMGIVNIVKEIRSTRDATIVVNGILPRPGDASGRLRGTLWEDIVWINQRLQCFTEGEDGVEFFNATDVFANDTHIYKERLPDLLHPSAEGARVWGTEIVKRVKELLQT